jgi:hypothetical protein
MGIGDAAIIPVGKGTAEFAPAVPACQFETGKMPSQAMQKRKTWKGCRFSCAAGTSWPVAEMVSSGMVTESLGGLADQAG